MVNEKLVQLMVELRICNIPFVIIFFFDQYKGTYVNEPYLFCNLLPPLYSAEPCSMLSLVDSCQFLSSAIGSVFRLETNPTCFLLLPKVRKIEIPNIPSNPFLLSPTIPSRKNPHFIMLPMSLCQSCQRATCDRDLYCYRAYYLFNISPP